MQQPTLEELELMAATTATRLGLRLPLTEEQLILCQTLAEHEQTMRQLRDNLSEIRRNPPPPEPKDGHTEDSFEAWAQYEDSLYRAQLLIVQEDCCFHLPLGHEFGEREGNLKPDGSPRYIEDWIGAPGVRRDN